MKNVLNIIFDFLFLILFPFGIFVTSTSLAQLDKINSDIYNFYFGYFTIFTFGYFFFYAFILGRIKFALKSREEYLQYILLSFSIIGISLILLKYYQSVATCESINFAFLSTVLYFFISIHLSYSLYRKTKKYSFLFFAPPVSLFFSFFLLIFGYIFDFISLPGWQVAKFSFGGQSCNYLFFGFLQKLQIFFL